MITPEMRIGRIKAAFRQKLRENYLGLTIYELSAALAITPGMANRIGQELAAAGFVERRAVPGRVMFVSTEF